MSRYAGACFGAHAIVLNHFRLEIAMRLVVVATLIIAAAGVRAETPADFQARFSAQAKQENPAFTGFSADQGQRWYARTQGREWSCASCHARNPAATGQHAATGKLLAPLAPAANPERFTRSDKVEKWFKRNCNDVLGRPCTAQEKGDVLAYLLTVR
ncbi:MAG: DUF1924 domain-containing protein [Candidatus Contendobacter sp.]|nr:DUF1924 domain-containing protein [Candidatus Contendobacter sp.]